MNIVDNYRELVKNRKIYLEEVTSLGDNWCDNNSFTPNKYSTNLSSELLDISVLLSEEINKAPELIMGPLISGGMSIEFRANNYLIVVRIFNDGILDLEYLTDEDNIEICLTAENFLSKSKIELRKLMNTIKDTK